MEQREVTRRSFLKGTTMTAAVAALSSVAAGGPKGLVPTDKLPQSAAVQVVKTNCRACIHNCGVLASVQNGRIIKLEGNPEYPMSQGALCAEGLAGLQALYHPSRNKYPLKRVGNRGEGKWQRISWDEAIDTIAQKLMETRAKYGAESVFCSTGGGGNPQFMSIARFAWFFGTPNWIEPGCAQCYLPRTCITSLMYGGQTSSIADSAALELYYPDTTPIKCAVMWGTVPAYDSPAGAGRCMAELRARGLRTVVIDPRLTPDAAKADVWLPIRPGTDVALMLAWIKYILDNNLYDPEMVMKWSNLPFLANPNTLMLLRESDIKAGGDANTFVVWDQKSNSAKGMKYPWDDSLSPALTGSFSVNGITCKTGFQLLKDEVEPYTVQKAAEICLLDANKITQAIKLYATNTPSGIIHGVATDQHVNSSQAAQAALTLDMLMGNVEKPGAILQRYKGAPVIGGVSPIPRVLPQEQFLKRLGMVDHKGLLQWGGGAAHIPHVLSAIMTCQPYKPRVWIERSGNKLAMLGNSTSWYNAIKELDFIVHMYMYPTSFSAMADILLPAAEWLETNLPVPSCNMVFARQAVVQTWETMDETLMWAKLAKRLADLGHEGCKLAFDAKALAPDMPYWSSMEEVLDKWVAGLNMTWKEFTQKQPITFAPLEQWRLYYAYKQTDAKTGLPAGFATPSKKLEIYQERLVVLGRTGAPYVPYPAPPVAVDYHPLPYYIEPGESPISTPDVAKQYPLVLTSGRLPYYHHGTLRNIPWLRELYPVPELSINPDTANNLGVAMGDWVWIESRRGKIRAKARLTEGIAPGTVYMERFWYPELPETDPSLYGWNVSSVNVLTKNDPPYNPEFGTYTLRGFQVKVSKAAEGAPAGIWQQPQDFTPWLPTQGGM